MVGTFFSCETEIWLSLSENVIFLGCIVVKEQNNNKDADFIGELHCKKYVKININS